MFVKRKTPIKRNTPIRRTPLKRSTTPIKRGTKCIKKVSASLAADLKKYYPERDAFLLANRYCQIRLLVANCQINSSEVHHPEGRGIYLLKKETWIATCRNCHTYIGENHQHSVDQGFVYLRNTKQYFLDLQKYKNRLD